MGKHNKKEKKDSFLRFIASLLVSTLIIGVGAILIGGILGSVLGYYRIETVLSGSMRPTYPPGSVIVAFTKPKEALKTGDVIIFRSPETYGGETVTHRVVSARITDTGDVYVRTKGDANNVADPWEARVTSEEVWKVEGSFPKIGYIAVWANKWWPMLLAIALSFPMLTFANSQVREVYMKPKRASRENT